MHTKLPRTAILVLKSVYEADPFCIGEELILMALECDQLRAIEYLASILDIKTKVEESDIWQRLASKSLELVEWAHQYYNLGSPTQGWLIEKIIDGSLDIIDWALRKNFISKTEEIYLDVAARWNQLLILQRLINFGMSTTSDKDYIIPTLDPEVANFPRD
jgi:hypothetical protein